MTKTVAIIVAAGKGTRMGGDIPKQFMNIAGKPMVYYSIKAFEDSECDEIIVVTNADSIDYVQTMIVNKYDFKKVVRIVAGGKQRYDSVYEGIKACEGEPIVLIHDGARPMITPNIINAVIAETMMYDACAVATKMVDTVRLISDGSWSGETLDRSRLCTMQTPQAFKYHIIKPAYDQFMIAGTDREWFTDDVMIAEIMLGVKSHLVEGSRNNIKVTNPEDIKFAEAVLG